MKFKLILITLLIQVTIITKAKAQFFGVSDGTLFTPLSTLDIRGTLGVNLFKDTSSTSTATAAAAIILNSTVLYSSLNGNGRSSLQLPAPASAYLNRVYIITNSTPNNKTWDIQNGVFYYDFKNVQIFKVVENTAIMIICNGTDWVQIN